MSFNSTICPRNCPKRRQKAPKTAQCAPAPRNQERAVSWATWLKNEFRGHLVHPQPPTFYGFQAFELPNETPRPPYQWSLGAAGGPASPRTLGANGGSTGVPGAKKMIFFKVVPRPLGMLKQLLLARFEPVVARFGPRKIPKCLENGPFWDQKWLKNGSKKPLFKSDRGPFGMPKQVFLARFEPVVARFGPRKIPKCLENGPIWDQKWVKNGSKKAFLKSDRCPFGMPKQVFWARFDPVVARFGPRKIPKCLQNGPFCVQKWLKNGSKKRFLKSDRGPFGMLEQVFLTRLEPVVPRFGPRKSQYALKRGHFGTKKSVKNGSKTHCSKSDPRPFGRFQQGFLAFLEPEITRFGPWRIPKCLENGPLWDKN